MSEKKISEGKIMQISMEQLEKLVKQGESHTLEFKKSTGTLKSACETACAFLNGDGGTILIGITDDKHILGQDVSDKTKREIGNELAKITPVPSIEINYLPLSDSNKYVILLHVTTDSTKRPYMYDNRAFMRIESDTIPMPREYLNQLTLINGDGKYTWENQASSDVTLDDLDTKEIIATIKEGSINGRIPSSYMTDDPEIALQRLGLIENGKIINAAVILFGKAPERKFPQCILRLARFKGTDKSEFIDNKQITGNIFQLLNEAMAFANTYLPIASTFPKNNILRKDIPLFPLMALREAIANALCHRDYSYYGGSISFAIYDDRLEIWNYGSFPPGITLKNLKNLNCSIPRNRKIANVLYYHKIFESWGRGVHMIITECKKAGHPEPFYSQDSVGTTLTLPSHHLLGSTSPQPIQSPISLEELSGRQIEIITILRNHKSLSPDGIRTLMKHPLPERTLRFELNRLEKLGFINSTGQTRTRKWHPKI